MRLWGRRRTSTPGLTCNEVVELVTDYLEGCLDGPTRARFEAHINLCEECSEYIEQLGKTRALVGALHEEHLSEPARHRLMSAFHDWREQGT
jgi:anti-sigma factor RsiW